jgi:peptidoglycan/LPS O-acetylase OafA/YrhL
MIGSIQASQKINTKPPVINSLTGIRALGAWWVVIYHLQPELVPLISQQSFLVNFVGFGHIGVTLFFVLSGFILSYNYAQAFKSLSASTYCNFIGQRLARIYPVHLATLTLLLTLAILANLGGHPLGTPEKYSTLKFFQHIFLVNGWTLPIETSWNGVAWTLSVEWLCYLIFPIISVLTFNINKPGIPLFAITLLLIGVVSLGLPGGIYELSMFVAGVFLGRLYISRFGENFNWEPINAICLLAIVFLGSSLSSLGLDSSTIAVFMILFIYGLVWGDNFTTRLFGSSTMVYWGYTSYSLYMTHTIVLLLLRNIIPFDFIAAQGVEAILLTLIFYILIISVIARFTYVLIEEPGRIWVKTKIKMFKT